MPDMPAHHAPSFPDRFNLARYLLDARVEEGRGGRPAVHVGDATWSYAQVQALANRAAHALRDLGVTPESRVLLALPDGIEFVAAWFGTLKLGAVFAMANTILPEETYAYYLDYTRAPVAVIHEDLLPKFAAVAGRARFLRNLLVVESAVTMRLRESRLLFGTRNDQGGARGATPGTGDARGGDPDGAPDTGDARDAARTSIPDMGHPRGGDPGSARGDARTDMRGAGDARGGDLLGASGTEDAHDARTGMRGTVDARSETRSRVPGAGGRDQRSLESSWGSQDASGNDAARDLPEALRGRAAWFHQTLAGCPDELDTFDTHRDDVAGWLFTSGSTGDPKAAVHSHEEFAFNVETYAKRVVGYRESDITVSVPKLFFGYATGTNLIFPFAAGGATALFPDRSTPERIFEMIERYRPTILTSVPTMINAMLQVPGAEKKDLSCLRACLSAGEALPVELYHRWVSAFGVEILDGIGSAEMFHIYISGAPGEVVPGSLGRIVPGYEARLVGPDGRDVPPGGTGTLWIRGGSTARGYWLDREKSRHTFRGDWCVTGDQFRVDEKGYFWYGGRTDDLLKVSGIFVTPLEIEDCLYGHEAVRDVCVVGGEDADGLTHPRAYVTLKEGHPAGRELALQLKELAKRRLAPYKYPRWFCFVEELPRNDRGKVQRKLIREGYPLKPLCEEIDVGGKR